MLIGGQAEAQTEFGVIFEQRVGPGGAAPFRVMAPGCGRQIATVDGGATGGVGHHHTIPEQLAEGFQIRRFAAAATGAGKLKQRLEELHAAYVGEIHSRPIGPRELFEPVERPFLCVEMRQLLLHADGPLGLRLTRLAVAYRAGFDAQAAAGAILGIDLEGVACFGEATRTDRGRAEVIRCASEPILMIKLGANGRVRADKGAVTALNTQFGAPDGDLQRDVALLEAGGAGGVGAIGGDQRDRDTLAAIE